MISYLPFFQTIHYKRISMYSLKKKNQISSGAFDRMRKRKYLSTHTIDDLCRALDCRVEDIMEYIPDEKQRKCSQKACIYVLYGLEIGLFSIKIAIYPQHD